VNAHDPVSRRRAAKLIGTAAVGTILPIGVPRTNAASASSGMLTRSIPSSGERLPVIGLGSATTFDVRSSSQLQPLGEVLSLFVKHGGKLIDTSPMYGQAEENIGELATKLRLHGSLFLATKVWTNGKQEGVAQMERSMSRLQAGKIDLIQVHNLVDVDSQMGSLRELKGKGKIRYTGITHSESRGFGEVERVMRSQKPDFVQINYSLVDRGAAARILPLAQELHMGVIINRPFGGGGVLKVVSSKPLPAWAAEFDCHSWPQFLLKWIIAHPAATCVIPATNNPQHLEDNMMAGVGRLPDAKTRQRMASLFTGFS
jgi:diketogulonate reductase-like aldo/keto reductase